jgi:hypothetical protein
MLAKKWRGALLFHTYAVFKREIEEIQSLGYGLGRYVSVIGCNDSAVCPACKSVQQRGIMPIAEVPELPLETCTHEIGCRCSIAYALPPE